MFEKAEQLSWHHQHHGPYEGHLLILELPFLKLQLYGGFFLEFCNLKMTLRSRFFFFKESIQSYTLRPNTHIHNNSHTKSTHCYICLLFLTSNFLKSKLSIQFPRHLSIDKIRYTYGNSFMFCKKYISITNIYFLCFLFWLLLLLFCFLFCFD